MSVRILIGDVRERLKELPDESVHCVVTSPPYWGLRDYGCIGQIGLERTLGEYLAEMVGVFREVRRVLRKDGTLWLNIGDSYAASVNGRKAVDIVNDDRTFRDKPFSTIGPIYDPSGGAKGIGGGAGKHRYKDDLSPRPGRVVAGGLLKPKDICGIPWRVAFALQADGWWLRQDIIWHKPNPMPESVTDRCTKAHEYLFLLSKSERYFYDQDAVSEPLQQSTIERGYTAAYMDGVETGKSLNAPNEVRAKANWRANPYIPETRNRRSVWTITTQPYSEAHFATFPPELPELCIKAGTSEYGVCRECGAPWDRIVEHGEPSKETTRGRQSWTAETGQRDSAGGLPVRSITTLGWRSSCRCKLPNRIDATPWSPVPATVLDPFGGAGTTGLVADRLGRSAILIELNPEYAELARSRIHGDAPLFTNVEAVA